MERFLDMVQRLGFDRRQLDRSNKMFLMAEFKKSGRRPEDGVEFEAKVRCSLLVVEGFCARGLRPRLRVD